MLFCLHRVERRSLVSDISFNFDRFSVLHMISVLIVCPANHFWCCCTALVNDLGGSRSGEGASSKAADVVVDEIKAKGGKAVANYG